MARKKKTEAAEASKAPARSSMNGDASTIAVMESPAPAVENAATAVEEPATPDTPPAEPGFNDRPFSNPYRPVFSSKTAGFELGENYRFKQRVFSFDDKPADHIIATLKENGFTYRPAEKSWTIPASAETRLLTDRLAREFTGQEHAASR
jgi:hypothetical protein